MSRQSRRDDDGRRGQRMDPALKGYLVKRMKQMEEEARQKAMNNSDDDENNRTSKETDKCKERLKRMDYDDHFDTPSSLSESENEGRTKKTAKKSREQDLPSSLSDSDDNRKSSRKKKRREKSYEKNDLQITIKRGRSQDRDLKDKENHFGDHRSAKEAITPSSRDESDRHSRSRSKRSRSERSRRSRSRSKRSRSRSRSKRSRSRSRSRRRGSREVSPDSSPKRKSKKSTKDKKKAKKEKKRKKEKKEKKRKKRRLSDEEAEYDENGERIDYDFDEPDPDEFAEDGEVSDEESTDEEEEANGGLSGEGLERNESAEGGSDTKGHRGKVGEGLATSDASSPAALREGLTEESDTDPGTATDANDLRKIIVGKRHSVNASKLDKVKTDSDCGDSEKTSETPTVEAIVAVAKACRQIKRMEVTKKPLLKADDVFERDDNQRLRKKPAATIAVKTTLGIKLSDTSETLIKNPTLSYDEQKKVFLEDGEVADSDDEKTAAKDGDKSSSSDVDVNDLSSTGSIKDEEEEDNKKKKKEKRKKKKKEKKKKRHRSVSAARSPSPKKRLKDGIRNSRDKRDSRDKRESRDGGESRDRVTSRDRDERRRDSRMSRDPGLEDRSTVRRRSGSPSGRRRSRSPGWPSGRWRSPSPRTRRRSRSPIRRRSRSPAHYQWRKRADIARDYRQRIKRSRTPVRERLGRRSRSASLGIDKAALRAAAIRNTLEQQRQGKLEELGLNLSAADLSRIRSGASEDQKQLTEYCKTLMTKPGEAISDDEPTQLPVSSDEDSQEEGELAENKTGIQINIKNAKPLPILTPAERVAQSAVLSKQFPVSSGSTHRKHENEWVPVEPKPKPVPMPMPKPAPNMPKPKPERVSTLSGIAFSQEEHTDQPQTLASVAQQIAVESSAQVLQPAVVEEAPAAVPAQERIFPVQTRPGNIGDLVTQRLAAMKRAALNPNDVEAIAEIYEANKKIEEWTSSKMVPGQFLGSTDAKILTREELEGNKRNQCWAKPGQFQSAEPVKGLGMFLLEKMGWKQGTGLGKNNEGPVTPLMLDLKNDRKGLISNEEIIMKPSDSNPRARARPIRDLSEKHPISALMELCQRRKWSSPNFIEIMEEGPAHKRMFKFKVIVNGVEYQPTVGSKTKKAAKADSANVCLQALGLVPKL